MTIKLAGQIYTNQTLVGEDSGDRKSHILENSIREMNPVIDLRGLKTGSEDGWHL
jgi:hypothetical protein